MKHKDLQLLKTAAKEILCFHQTWAFCLFSLLHNYSFSMKKKCWKRQRPGHWSTNMPTLSGSGVSQLSWWSPTLNMPKPFLPEEVRGSGSTVEQQPRTAAFPCQDGNSQQGKVSQTGRIRETNFGLFYRENWLLCAPGMQLHGPLRAARDQGSSKSTSRSIFIESSLKSSLLRA